jgi:hypothetical protein
VVNAFCEEERDLFFIFCTDVLTQILVHEYRVSKQRMQNQAGELLFDEDTLEMIFFEILLRLDFSGEVESGNNFSKEMYLCFERFFIYVNQQYG